MIHRRSFILGLLVAPSFAKGESTLLNSNVSQQDLEQSLQSALLGLPLSETVATLTALGANGTILVDIGESDLPAGTELGDGLKAGEMYAVITFGLRRRFWQPDLRIQVRAQYDLNREYSALHFVRRIPK